MNSLKVWQASIANRAEGTQQKYLSHFQGFIKWTGLEPDKLREMKFRGDQTAKPWERTQVENLIRQYLAFAEGKFACNTCALSYVAIKSFFDAQGLSLNMKRQDRPSGCAFGSKVLTPEEIRRLKNATEYLREKALIMFLKDTGLRESDAAKLKWKDLKDYGEGFIGFEMQTKKQKTKARGFIGPETTEVLKLYKEKRMTGTQKIPKEESLEEHPIFALFTDPTKPLRAPLMSGALHDIISLASVEGATPHGLRKFWEQNTHTENPAYQKQMNGRALTEVERAYFWKDTPELFEMYKANYHNLRVERQDFRETEERLRNEYEGEIKDLREKLNQKNKELEGQVKEIEQKYARELDALRTEHKELRRQIEKDEIEPAWSRRLSKQLDEFHALEEAKVRAEGYKNMKEYMRALGRKVGREIRKAEG